MKKELLEMKLPSRLETIDEVAAKTAQIATENGIDEADLFGIDLAVREAVANAVKHGNKFDETKQVKITFEVTLENLTVTVEDEGEGFDLNSVPDPTDKDNLLKDSGRGILFMRNFMDDVVWMRTASVGTTVRLTKKI